MNAEWTARSLSTTSCSPAAIDGASESVAASGGGESVASDVWSSIRHTACLLSLEDVDLVDRAVGAHGDAPDPEAFGVLYERYVHAIFAFGLSRLHNSAQAEDITSQTFLQALQALPRYTHRGVPIRHWLFAIAANAISGNYRAAPPGVPALLRGRDEQGREGQGGELLLDLPDPYAEAEIDACAGAEEFRQLVQVLTPEQRTVIRLRFADGLAVAAIAVRTGHTVGAVKALQFRGVQALRRRWNEETGMAPATATGSR